jgi:hypothetical protein
VQRLVHPLEPLLVRADVGEHPTVKDLTPALASGYLRPSRGR